MDPATVQLVIFALSEAIKAYPQLKSDIQATLSKENPTPEDWATLRARVSGENYFAFVPKSALPH